MDTARGIATAIRELMAARGEGVSENALAKATSIPRATLGRSLDLEAARVRPLNVDELDAIAQALDTTVVQIAIRAQEVAS